jgi:hypothetical protein
MKVKITYYKKKNIKVQETCNISDQIWVILKPFMYFQNLSDNLNIKI